MKDFQVHPTFGLIIAMYVTTYLKNAFSCINDD